RPSILHYGYPSRRLSARSAPPWSSGRTRRGMCQDAMRSTFAVLTSLALGCSTPSSPPPARSPAPPPAPDATADTDGSDAPPGGAPPRADQGEGDARLPSPSTKPASAATDPVDAPTDPVDTATTPAPLPAGTAVRDVGSSTAGARGIALKRELEERGV